MKLESDTTVQHSSATPSPIAGGSDTAWTASPLVAEVLAGLTDGSPRFVSRAPGRLDVIGGLAEYTGSLVLNMPVADHACVAVQRRADDTISITSASSLERNDGTPTLIAMSQLCQENDAPIDGERGRKLVDGSDADMVRCVLGAVAEMLRARLVPRFDGALSIVFGSTLDEHSDSGRGAALTAATIAAVAGVFGVTFDPLDAAAACQRVENHWLCRPVGIADAVCTLLGESQTLMQVRCDPCTIAGSVRLPADFAVIGIDCGAMHAEAGLKYARVRTAAFMGRGLIDRIIQHDGPDRLKWDGYLARISVSVYVERFRDRLPTRLRGGEYLERFGETGDPLTRIDADFVYKIRSRTEHHIYEHARSGQFGECLARAIHKGDEHALIEAGELMYASHWSYGQRCGLGSVETDLLVNLIREHGVAAGIYGAKITAGGCGGVVAVLMRASDRAISAVEAAVEQYRSRTGHTPKMMRGSSPGALASGVRQI